MRRRTLHLLILLLRGDFLHHRRSAHSLIPSASCTIFPAMPTFMANYLDCSVGSNTTLAPSFHWWVMVISTRACASYGIVAFH